MTLKVTPELQYVRRFSVLDGPFSPIYKLVLQQKWIEQGDEFSPPIEHWIDVPFVESIEKQKTA